MTNNKNLQKKLKGLDAFQKFFANLFNWLHAQRFVFGTILGCLLLVLASVFGWQFFVHKSTASRVEKVGEIESVYIAEEKKAQDEIEKLKKKMTPADKTKTPADTAKANPENKKIEEQIEKIKPDHKQSLGKFQDYFKNNSKYPQGWMAGLRASSILAQEKKFADAKSQLQALIEATGKSEFYQIQARFLLLGVLEEMKDYDLALKEVDQLLNLTEKDKELRPLVLFTKGRLLLNKNNREDANKAFAQLVKDFPESSEADKSRSLQLLYEKGH